MRWINFLSIIYCFLLTCLVGPVFSAPAVNYLGNENFARSIALGSAFDPVSSDLSALFANPAGINYSKNGSLASLFSQPFDDTTTMVLGWSGTAPLDLRYGVGYRNFSIANAVTSPEIANYIDQDISVAFGKEFSEKLAFGLTFRSLSRGLTKPLPGYGDLSAYGYSLDSGLIFHPSAIFSAGLMLQNLASQLTYGDGLVKSFDPEVVLGGSYSWEESDHFGLKKNQWLTLFVAANKKGSEPLIQFNLGGEWRPQTGYTFRAGLEQSPYTGSQNYTHFTLGFGLNLGQIDLDYAYKKLGDASGNQTHYFSMTYSPQELLLLSAQPLSSEAELFPTPESTAILKVKRKTFFDVPAGYWAKEEIELLATAGIINGFPDGSFQPEKTLNREDLFTFLVETKSIDLIVVPEPQEIVPGREALAAFSLPSSLLREPEKPLTRAELAYIYYQTPAGQAAVRRLRELID
jgi:hypothetical protein